MLETKEKHDSDIAEIQKIMLDKERIYRQALRSFIDGEPEPEKKKPRKFWSIDHQAKSHNP